jgi:zinc protease
VRNQEIAASIGSGYNAATKNPTLFMISATPARAHTVKELEAAIRAQLKRVQDEPVAESELERVKAQVAAGNVFQRDSIFYQAMQMGTLETVGLDWRMLDRYVDRIQAVTAAQVQAVAKKYLTESNLTVTVLEPQPGSTRPRPARPAGGAHVH